MDRNPIYDRPTHDERAARELREQQRKDRGGSNNPLDRVLPAVGSAVSSAVSSVNEWITESRGETDAEGIERRRNEREARAAETAEVLANRQRDAAGRAAANQPTAEERSEREARNTRVDELTPEQRETIRNGAAGQSPNEEDPLASFFEETGGGDPSTAPSAGAANEAIRPNKKLSDFIENIDFRESQGDVFGNSNYEDRPGGPQRTRSAGTFNIQEFRTNVTRGADNVLPTHSFLVTFPKMNWVSILLSGIYNVERLLTMRCENVIAPVMSFLQENIVRRYGYGPLENVPYGVNSQEFTLQFIVDKDSLIPEFFEQWMNFIINRDSFGGANMLNTQNGRDPYEVQYKDNYVAPMVNIQVYDRKQTNVMSYKIYDVFPNNIQSINLNWSDVDQLMRLNVSFSFTDFRLITQNEGKAIASPIKQLQLGTPFDNTPTSTTPELSPIGLLNPSTSDFTQYFSGPFAPGAPDATTNIVPEDTPPTELTPTPGFKNLFGV